MKPLNRRIDDLTQYLRTGWAVEKPEVPDNTYDLLREASKIIQLLQTYYPGVRIKLRNNDPTTHTITETTIEQPSKTNFCIKINGSNKWIDSGWIEGPVIHKLTEIPSKPTQILDNTPEQP